MLILTRKRGESILIDGGIEIKITEISGDKIKLGISAPPDVRVYRKELYETECENKTAAQAGASADAVKALLKKLQ